MDTRFWGPSGWKLLHVSTFLYPIHPTETQKKDMSEFLEILPYILPCKFCRYSLSCYYETDSPSSLRNLQSRGTLTRWLWKIHNKVNNKLRTQNLNPTSNPSFQTVSNFYNKWLKTPQNYMCYLPTFWNFLFAVAYNHPKETKYHSTPMPECPEAVFKCTNGSEQNKWNILPYKVRISWYKKFWKSLPKIFGNEFAGKWQEAERITCLNIKNRRSTIAWLWRMRCYLDPDFKDPYTEICTKIANYSSDCHKLKRAKTCRRKSRNQLRRQNRNTRKKALIN